MRSARSKRRASWRRRYWRTAAQRRDRQTDEVTDYRRAHRDRQKMQPRKASPLALREPSLKIPDPEQRQRRRRHRGDESGVITGPAGGNQDERQQRHHRADQERDAHRDAVDERAAQRLAAQPVHLDFGGREQGLRRGTKKLDDPVRGLAAQALVLELVEQAFLEDVGLDSSLFARALELATQHFGLSPGAEIGPGAHRERAGGGRGECGEDYLAMDRDGAA